MVKYYHCWPRGKYYSVHTKFTWDKYGNGSNFKNFTNYQAAYRLHMKQHWKLRHMDIRKNVPWLMLRGFKAYCIMAERETKRWKPS